MSRSLRRGRPFVLLYPGQVNALHKVANRDDSLSWNCTPVYGRHVTFCFLLYVGGRPLAARRHSPKVLCDSLPFHSSSDVATLPIADIPPIPNSDDLTVLFAVPH